MTDRLYYADSYLEKFEARVLAFQGGAARLDRTAFYPTSGGQPYDTGTLGGLRVTDVYADEGGEVWHAVDGVLKPGAQVEGQIDWPRRFDHMQQHAGEHMLAGAIYRRLGGHTIGLHLGAEISTIDVELPGGAMRAAGDVLDEIEDAVNRDIQRDLPIRCWFPSAEQLEALPLRKPPAVRENIRVVLVGDEKGGECVACGGTHPDSAGQIGLVRILDARPSRGKMRVTFVCGMRAIKDARARARAADGAAAKLSVPFERLCEAVDGLLERERAGRAALEREVRAQALSRVDDLLRTAREIAGWRVVTDASEGLGAAALRDLASAITGRGRTAALLESAQPDGSFLIVFARSPGEEPGPGLGEYPSMGRLLSEAVGEAGGKGGGRPDFAQGGAPVSGVAARGAQLFANTVAPDRGTKSEA